MTDVQLSAALNTTLDAVHRIQALSNRRAGDLSSGRERDDARAPADYVAQSLSGRASDLLAVKDSIQQGTSKSQVALDGLHTIDKTLDQLKAIALQYQNTGDADQQAKLQSQFDTLSQQVDNFARDSSLGGTQLISAQPDDLTIPLSDSSAITIGGQASDSGSLGFSIADVASIDAAKDQVRAAQQSIGTDASAIDIRRNFTDALVNRLEEGAAKLTEVDLNAAAAEAMSAQTRAQLSFAAIALAAKSDRAILQLF